MNDELTKRPPGGSPFDDEFITLTEVARDPVAAWMTIVDNAVRIEALQARIDELERERDALAIVVKFYDEDKKQRDGFFKKWFGISTQEEMIAQYNRLMEEEADKNQHTLAQLEGGK
jgi:phosphopantothenate synthetase